MDGALYTGVRCCLTVGRLVVGAERRNLGFSEGLSMLVKIFTLQMYKKELFKSNELIQT